MTLIPTLAFLEPIITLLNENMIEYKVKWQPYKAFIFCTMKNNVRFNISVNTDKEVRLWTYSRVEIPYESRHELLEEINEIEIQYPFMSIYINEEKIAVAAYTFTCYEENSLQYVLKKYLNSFLEAVKRCAPIFGNIEER